MDTFFDSGVDKNFVFRARITVILTSDSFGYESLTPIKNNPEK